MRELLKVRGGVPLGRQKTQRKGSNNQREGGRERGAQLLHWRCISA